MSVMNAHDLSSAFWHWRELVYLHDNLSAAHHQRKEAWEGTSFISPSLAEEAGDASTGVGTPALSLQVTTFLGVSGHLSWETDRILSWDSPTSSPDGRRCLPYFMSGDKPSVPQAAAGSLWAESSAISKNKETPSTSPAAKPVLGSGERSAASYLTRFQMLCFLFLPPGGGAGAGYPLPRVKLFPLFTLTRTHFTLVWGQVVSCNLSIAKTAEHFASVHPSLCVSYRAWGRANSQTKQGLKPAMSAWPHHTTSARGWNSIMGELIITAHSKEQSTLLLLLKAWKTPS